MGTVRRGNLHGEHEREDQSGETLRAAPRCSRVDDGRMSVTPPVSHVEMWPYVASAAVGFESHAATAVFMLLSVIT